MSNKQTSVHSDILLKQGLQGRRPLITCTDLVNGLVGGDGDIVVHAKAFCFASFTVVPWGSRDEREARVEGKKELRDGGMT